MLIVGAGGFAKELLQVLTDLNYCDLIQFYDDINPSLMSMYGKYNVLKNEEECIEYFSNVSKRYALGVGNPKIRKLLYLKFNQLGGEISKIVSPGADIGKFVEIGGGAAILSNVTISNSVKVGLAPLIYYNSVITHDCVLGDFVELSPGATLLGNVNVGNCTHIGANATILPNISIGKNVIVGAGAVVTKNIPDSTIVAGVPASIIRHV